MIRKALGLSMMVGVVSLFAFACGDDDDAAGAKYPSADSFCTAKAQLECSSSSVATCGVTAEACQAKRKAACTTAGNGAVGRAYASGNAEACLNLVKDIYGNPNDATKLRAYLDACERVYAGSKTKGQGCAGEYDCSGALICDLQKATPLCADKSAAKAENDGCANSGDVCGTGLYCAIENPPLCKKLGAVGADCSNTKPCVETAFCHAIQKCTALGATGADCKSNEECSSLFCNSSKKCAGRQFPTETSTCADFGG